MKTLQAKERQDYRFKIWQTQTVIWGFGRVMGGEGDPPDLPVDDDETAVDSDLSETERLIQQHRDAGLLKDS